MVNSDPLRGATRTPPRPERRGGPSGGPAGGLQGPLYGPPGDGSGGKGPPSGPTPPRAVLGRGGGPPLPGLAGGGRAPRRRGAHRRRPPGPGTSVPVPRGGYRGGGPHLAGTYRRTERGGFRSGEALGTRPGSSPLDGNLGIRAPRAKKNTVFTRWRRRGSRRSPWRRGVRVRPSGGPRR